MRPDDILPFLESLPALLQRAMSEVAEGDLARGPAAGGFALVEHAWHLADLEVEGYGVRIERLLREEDPELPDFDGPAIARARSYPSLDAAEGASRFRLARAENLARLRGLPPPAWARSGRQIGVGRVTVADLPRMMRDHDRSHARELADLLAEIAPRNASLPALRALAGSASPGSGRKAS